MPKTFGLLVLATCLAGCASVQKADLPNDYRPSETRTEHRIDTTYTVGEPQEVFVGERMLRVQDYYVTTRQTASSSARLNPSQTFTMTLPPLTSVTLETRDAATIVGTTEREGRTYRLVQLPGAPVLRFLIDDDGAFQGSAINHMGARMGWSYTPSPASVRLVPSGATSLVDATKGFTNFEIVYGGTTRESLHLMYREYTRDDLVRPAFSQNLVYERDNPTIRFRHLQIEVHEATNEKIRFTVVSDVAPG
jgi:hypothetical protein